MILALIFSLLLKQQLHAQSADIPHLRRIMLQMQANKNFAKDTAYIDILDSLAFAYYRINADSVFLYSNKALAYAEQMGYGKGASASLRLKGNAYLLIGDYASMLSCYQQALTIAEKINDPISIAKASINMATRYYNDMGKYDEEMVLLKKAGDIFEKMRDSLNWHKALISYGGVWENKKQYEKALQYYQRALAVATAMKDNYSVVVSNDNIGIVLFREGLYKEALSRFLRTKEFFSHTDDKMRQMRNAIALAQTYFKLKDHRNALQYAQLGLRQATEIRGENYIKEADLLLADIYEAKGDASSALKYFRAYKEASDSVLNETMLKKTGQLEAKYEYEKKESRLKEEQKKKDALHQLLLYIAVLMILFLSVLAFLLCRSRAAKQKHNQLLAAMNEEIEQQAVLVMLNNKQKDKLFSIIAHDLKMPLHSLRNMLALLNANELPEEVIKEVMEELGQDVNYSAELVSNMLSWAGSQLDGRIVSPVELPVHQLVSDTMGLFIKQAADKKISMKNDIHPALLVWADKNMVQVMIRNLVGNAIKFCNAGDTITINSKTAGAVVEICVADTGIGIPADVLRKLGRKESVTTYGTANERGTGLGMLLCHEFAEANNGRFSIESEQGKGSRFYFTLPAVSDPG
ncbi:hypothetical protein A3860_10055 [Niastella vici]|uniref:histidine kinase n=2 Tax=Niastella vici TaxID=1703345 RepID=A0A1V9FEX5_9BACT|nr:hypothetical protein A3860_10055 [Niastella vici]